MSRTHRLALAALALAGLTASGCDALVQQSLPAPAATELEGAEPPAEGDCISCLKFRARPPAGINVPPQLP